MSHIMCPIQAFCKVTKSFISIAHDESRMCVVHGCIAEKVNIKVSKFKKDIGFYKETVTKLRCSEHRTGGSTVSDIDSVHVLSDPAAPDLRTLSLRDGIAHRKTGISLQEGGNDCDWMRTNREIDSRVVIGRITKFNSYSTLESKATGRDLDKHHSVLFECLTEEDLNKIAIDLNIELFYC